MRAAERCLLVLGLCLLLTAQSYSRDFFASEAYTEFSDEQRAALGLVLAEAETQDFLGDYPDWTAYSYFEDGLWVVGFEQGDEWLGDPRVNLDTQEVIYIYLPRDLSPEAYTQGREAVQALVLADAEVTARLTRPVEWDYDVYYNKYDAKWTMYLWRGIESLAVRLRQEGDYFYIEDIFDPDALNEQEAYAHDRNTAISLAYGADGLWQALDGVDNWFTYAEKQTADTWTIEFYGEGRSVMVLVDLAASEIVEVQISMP
jgi:hypothetical protein